MPPLGNLFDHWSQYLACPGCTGTLRIDSAGATIQLECSLCKARYPVHDGIPSFVHSPDDEQAAGIAQRDKEAASYEGNFLAWETFLEVVPLVRDLAPKSTDVVLDVGAGTGRCVREYIRDVAAVIAVDYSMESLRYMRRSMDLVGPAHGKLIPVHADATALPVRAGAFDSAISVGMLQHILETEDRARVISGMARALRPGGRFILQARHWSRTHAFHDSHRSSPIVRRLADVLIGNADGGVDAPRTSVHAGGSVSIYNITSDELRDLAERADLHVDRIVGRLMCVKGMNRLGVLRPVVERALERTPISLLAAQEVVAVATRPG